MVPRSKFELHTKFIVGFQVWKIAFTTSGVISMYYQRETWGCWPSKANPQSSNWRQNWLLQVHVKCLCNDTVYKANFKFSLSPIFYIEEMLTIICNSSNGLYFVYLFAVDHSFHCNLDLETCPDLETCLELVLLPNYIDLSYKQ